MPGQQSVSVPATRGRGREARRAKRTRRRNAAWIAHGGVHIPCVLWDISETGARLAAPRSKSLPAAFSLLLARDGSAGRVCRVVWRNDRQVGVEFVAGTVEDLEEALRRRPLTDLVTTPIAPACGRGRPIDGPSSGAAAALLLPGYGAQVLEKPAPRGVRISSFAAVMLAMLVMATVLFVVAEMQRSLDAPWALKVCDAAANFCSHPEWTAIAGGLMAGVYLAVRGMEL